MRDRLGPPSVDNVRLDALALQPGEKVYSLSLSFCVLATLTHRAMYEKEVDEARKRSEKALSPDPDS